MPAGLPPKPLTNFHQHWAYLTSSMLMSSQEVATTPQRTLLGLGAAECIWSWYHSGQKQPDSKEEIPKPRLSGMIRILHKSNKKILGHRVDVDALGQPTGSTCPLSAEHGLLMK